MNKLPGVLQRRKAEFLFLLVVLLAHSFFVFAEPIVPVTIEGYVFLEDGSGAPNGVPVIVNNTDLNRIFTTEVDAPPVPALRGIYSLSIEGGDGHDLVVRAYNDTHYGESFKVLSGSSAQINVTMNISRSAELFVNITSPLNDSSISPSSDFNVSVNITSFISDASNCDAILSLSNTDAMDVKNGNIISIPSILEDETVSIIFELESYFSGSSDIEVAISCASDDVFFEGRREDTVFNVSVIDDLPPVISILSPENNSVEKTGNDLFFNYIVDSYSSVDVCRLVVNGSVEVESFDVPLNVEQSFSLNAENGFYEWEIVCEDSSNNIGSSNLFYLDVSVFYPTISSIDLPEVINLNPGSTKNVVCDVIVEDGNGADDIDLVSAYLHFEHATDFIEDNNFVYFDVCERTFETGDVAGFSCSFDLAHYSVNGSWLCNVTATDNQGLVNNSFEYTLVDELYAINLSSTLLEYGDIPAGSLSDERALDVFNVGNMPLSVFVKGYGVVEGDGLGLVCDNNEEIFVGAQRFSTQTLPFQDKDVLSSSFSLIVDALSKMTSADLVSESTFWQLEAPASEVSSCEGTLVFSVNG